MGKPDFSNVKSRGAALLLENDGKLVKVNLFPSELGGQEIPQNEVYITPEAAGARQMIVGTLVRFVEEGVIDKMTVEPTYKGDSFVPARIVFHAHHSQKAGRFEPVIEVW